MEEKNKTIQDNDKTKVDEFIKKIKNHKLFSLIIIVGIIIISISGVIKTVAETAKSIIDVFEGNKKPSTMITPVTKLLPKITPTQAFKQDRIVQTNTPTGNKQTFTISVIELCDILRRTNEIVRLDKMMEYEPYLDEITVREMIDILTLLNIIIRFDALEPLLKHIHRALTKEEVNEVLDLFSPIIVSTVETKLRIHNMSLSK